MEKVIKREKFELFSISLIISDACGGLMIAVIVVEMAVKQNILSYYREFVICSHL